MFNKFSVIFELLLIIIFCFASNVFAADETAYNSIINSYINYYQSNGQDHDLPDEYYYWALKYNNDPNVISHSLDYFGYTLKDLNNDGIKELLVGTGATNDTVVTLSDAEFPEVSAVFTLVDGKPKLLINDIYTTNPHYPNKEIGRIIEVLEDNRISVYQIDQPYKNEKARDSDKTEIYVLQPDGNLKLERTYISQWIFDGSYGEYYIIENGVEKKLSKEEFYEIENKDSKDIRVPLASFKEYDPIGKNSIPSQKPSNPTEQPSNPDDSSSDGIDVFRLYNRLTGEHLYTTDENEANTLSQGDWNNEGVGWKSAKSGEPVYRLYCEVTKAHLFTSDQNEIDSLKASGLWSVDNNSNPIFYSGGSKTIYRLYNESLKMHLLTTDEGEYNSLANQGWNQEGPKFNCQ